jgi:hypothetical protein
LSSSWFKENQLIDIFYNGLTEGSRSYLDSVEGDILRHITVVEARELLNTIHQNYNDWHIEEEEVIHNKRGILELSNEDMKEASRSIKEKGIKTSHLKELSEMGVKLPNDKPFCLSKYMIYVLLKVMKWYHLLLKYLMLII